MWHMEFYWGIFILVFLYTPKCQANITVDLSSPYYSQQGANVTITWSYTEKEVILSKTWLFKAVDATNFNSLANAGSTGDPVILKDSPFRNINPQQPATLVITSPTTQNSGTYRFTYDILGGRFKRNDIDIIITVSPKATVKCNKEPGKVDCLCSCEGGNPTPNATWVKDGTPQKETRDLNVTLLKEKPQENDAGTYTCRCRSHDLEDDETVNLYKPKDVVFPKNEEPKTAYLGKEFTITCKATGYPEPTYEIYHNKTKLGTNGGVYTKQPAVWEDAGSYKCTAANGIGNASESFTLAMSGGTPPPPTTSTTTARQGSTPTGTQVASPSDSSSGLSTGAIAGIAIGAIVLVIIIGVIVYLYMKKRGEKDRVSDHDMNEDRSSTASRHRREAENAYDSPDQPQPANRHSDAPSAEMPPVYAQVDKSKKTKRPPPSAAPSLTYAALDPVALQPDSSKMRPRPTQDTDYAAIDLQKLQGDLV